MIESLSLRICVLGAVVALALAMLVGLLADASDRTNENFRWVAHSAEVIETTDEAMVGLHDAESGQRGFVLTHNPAFVQSFDQRMTEARRAIDRVVALTADNPAQNTRARELRALVLARQEKLREPMKLARGGDFSGAAAIIASGHGRDLMSNITIRSQIFLDEEKLLQSGRIDAASRRLSNVKWIAIVGGVVIALLKLLVSVILIRGIRQPIGIITSAMDELGSGDRKARVTEAMGSSEFEQLASGYNAMADRLEHAVEGHHHVERELQVANAELTGTSATLRERGHVIEMLGAMAHRMQASRTDEELAEVIRTFVPRVLPGVPGALFAHNNSRNMLIPIADWGGYDAGIDGFAPDQCWALRLGQSHSIAEAGSDIVCRHVGDETLLYHCEPLLAGGEVIGTLYLHGIVGEESRFRLSAMSENIASALVNHRLQRGLREQTIRDPLTGLFNRRYMEEALTLEIARASRSRAPLSLVMCDVDHFKRFNDEFGHDAGDAVLQAVSKEMRARFRDGDVVCRFGGEEFTVIAPGATLEEMASRVDVVRRAVAELELRHGGRALGSITMSFGIASWNAAIGSDGAKLIKGADSGLYRAKQEGRNRAVLVSAEAA